MLLTIFPIKYVGFAFDFSSGISGMSYTGALAAGFLQWLTMRKWVRHASWWVLANPIAWILGNAVPHVIGALLSLFLYFIFVLPELIPRGFYALQEFSPLFFGIGAGITVGITSGVTMMLLFRSTISFLNSPPTAA